MIHVIASIQIKKDQIDEFIEIFKANVPYVLKEKGCLAYQPCQDLATGLSIQDINETGVTIVEKWETLEDLQAHLSAPHMRTYQEKTKNMVKKLSVKVLEPV